MKQVSDSATRARVAGREAIAARTAWMLEIGHYRARCVFLKPVFEVQIRSNGTWCPLGRGKEPTELLERLLKTDTWKGLIAGITDAIVNRKR